MQTSVPQPYEHALLFAKTRPDALAVAGTGAEISYAQLADHASRIAGMLRDAGVAPGQVVGVELPSQLEVVFIQALFQLAAISCHPPTGDSPITLDWLVSLTPDGSASTIVIDGPWLGRTAVAPPADPIPYASDDDVCRLIFSSGTTGTPKAVPMSARNLSYRAEVAPTHWMARTPILCLLGLDTASGTTAFFTALTRGETYLLPSTDNVPLLSRFRVASIKGSPAQLSALADAVEAAPVALPELGVIQSVGTVLPEQLVLRLRALFDSEVRNLYGSSESGVLSIREDESIDAMDAGTIVHDMTVEIVDEADVAVAPGTVGFIRSRRPHQTPGYFRDPAASAAQFRDGWFYPGDMGSVVDGRLLLAGRTSELINAGGLKVDPARIDAVATGFPGLLDAAAFAHTDESGIERIGLAIVGTMDVAALVRHLQASLGAAAPTVVVRVAGIPRTTVGKVRRGELESVAKRHLNR